MSTIIATLLDEEYERTLKDLSEAQNGSEEAKWLLQKLTELHKERMNEQKADSDAISKEKELALKTDEIGIKKDEIGMRKAELHMREKQADSEDYYKMKELALKTNEINMKEKQTEEDRKDKDLKTLFDIANLVLNVAAIVIPCVWMGKGLKFEETGTYTSRTQQWVSNNLKLFKR